MSTSLKRALFIPLAASGLLFFIAAGVSNAQVQLTLQPGVQLSWPATNAANIYHLQWSSNPVSTWSDLIVLNGDGTTHSTFDPFAPGARLYQDLEIVPGTPPSAANPPNPGFETGSGSTATGWGVDSTSGTPAYGVRTNDNPHSGSWDFHVHLGTPGGVGALIQFSQPGVPVTGGATYPFMFYADVLPGSVGQVCQWRILWNGGGDTGFHTFNPGNNSYAFISNSVIVPASATSGTISFRLQGSASATATADIDIDDVVLGSSVSSPGTPASTNVLSVSTLPVASLSWLSSNGVPYYEEYSTNPAAGWWTNSFGLIIGNGGTISFQVPMTNSQMFFRLDTPVVPTLPATNLHQVPSGSTNAIGLAWNASPSLGVTGYQLSYTDLSTTTTNTTSLANVTSTIISGLISGDTYSVSIVAISGAGPSDPVSITAQPDATLGIVPLFNAFTTLQPNTVYDNGSALVTRIADRPRLRHSREDGTHDTPPNFNFALYDTYAIFYWQQRMTTIEIDDTTPHGGNSITYHMWSLNGLDTPNIRFNFQGQTTVAQYGDNEFANQVDGSLTNWSFTITRNGRNGNNTLHVGDKVEMEFSPFMVTVTNGQLNYYGGSILYVAGQGIVPWQTQMNPIDLSPGNDGPVDGTGTRVNIDSYPIPTNAWAAGANTMPYQYSGEPTHLFNQMSPATAPQNGEPFLLGRRLHHTSFDDGSHVGDAVDANGGNGTYTQQVGKLGPKFTNRSCAACHNENSRALPPAIGALMLQSAVHVGSDASGTPDPILGSVLQEQCTTSAPICTVKIGSYTIITNFYGDSTMYTLQKPNYVFTGSHVPAYYSVRLAPQLVGMGLLEAVDESVIEANAGAQQNGVNGTVRVVTDPVTAQARLGRFTYRGGQAMVAHQVASALNHDMGVTTTIFPVLDGDVSSGPVELSDGDLTNWMTYVMDLGVNAQRNPTDPTVLQGQALFGSANCWQCHTPTLHTSPFHPMAEFRNQTIHPYTDLLLHDMGPGLADNLGEGNATGSQWRTSPLWSIELNEGINGGEAYLHDGRARNLAEAILWHDGEGAASREAFRNMSASDRAALIAFLQSL